MLREIGFAIPSTNIDIFFFRHYFAVMDFDNVRKHAITHAYKVRRMGPVLPSGAAPVCREKTWEGRSDRLLVAHHTFATQSRSDDPQSCERSPSLGRNFEPPFYETVVFELVAWKDMPSLFSFLPRKTIHRIEQEGFARHPDTSCCLDA